MAKGSKQLNKKVLGSIIAIVILLLGGGGYVTTTQLGDKETTEVVTTTADNETEEKTTKKETVENNTTKNEETTEKVTEEETTKKTVQYKFRSKSQLDGHYEKHGIEMGFKSAADYEAAASAVVNNPKAFHKLEAEDGDDIYYIEETNEFVVVSTDGYIRTYFYPSAGKDYYDRQ